VTIRPAFWFAGAVLLVAALVLTVHVSSNNLEFSRYNTGWNGTSAFFSDLDRHQVGVVTDIRDLSRYPNNTLLLVIAPSRAPTAAETAAYRSFVTRGNTLFLTDDFGNGNAILENLGSTIAILPGNLSSIDREYADAHAVIAYRAGNGSFVTNTVSLVLNRPAALEGGDPLLMSTVLSWIDENADRRINGNEVMGQFPVMAEEQIGSGKVVVFSDPSIFINSMLESNQPGDNRRFVQDLTGGNGTILVDQVNSRTAHAEGASEILHLIRTTIVLELIALSLLVAAVIWAWRRKIV
jgi:hypothetical protein